MERKSATSLAPADPPEAGPPLPRGSFRKVLLRTIALLLASPAAKPTPKGPVGAGTEKGRICAFQVSRQAVCFYVFIFCNMIVVFSKNWIKINSDFSKFFIFSFFVLVFYASWFNYPGILALISFGSSHCVTFPWSTHFVPFFPQTVCIVFCWSHSGIDSLPHSSYPKGHTGVVGCARSARASCAPHGFS